MQGRDQVDASVPKKYHDEIAKAQVQGALLQQEDFAVWLASSALVQSGTKAPGTATGWLAVARDANGPAMAGEFHREIGQAPGRLCRIQADISKPPGKIGLAAHATPRGLTPDEAVLVRARDAIAGNKDWLRCSDDYNYSLSFRQGKKGRETLVRALPARHEQKLYLLGGFHEFVVPGQERQEPALCPDNTCVEATLPKEGTGSWSRTCARHAHAVPRLRQPVLRPPVYVKIGSRTWLVKDGRVSVLDKNSVKSLKMRRRPHIEQSGR
jgi:hypothetical protein